VYLGNELNGLLIHLCGKQMFP